jgi:helix-turn-helix protein
MERPTRSESRNFQAPTGETPVVPTLQERSNELAVPAQQAETIEVFTAQLSVQEDLGQQEPDAPPLRGAGRNNGGNPQKPSERAPSGELYRGSFIRELRKARGLDTKTVAAQLGYTRARTLQQIEGNFANASPAKLDKLAELYDVPVAELQQAPVHPRTAARRKVRAQLNH